MKTQKTTTVRSNKGHNNQNRPDIRDDMDSRENKEEGYKTYNNSKGKKPNLKAKNKAGN